MKSQKVGRKGARQVRRLGVGKKEEFQEEEVAGDKLYTPAESKGPLIRGLYSRWLPGENTDGGMKLERQPGFKSHHKGFGISSTGSRTTESFKLRTVLKRKSCFEENLDRNETWKVKVNGQAYWIWAESCSDGTKGPPSVVFTVEAVSHQVGMVGERQQLEVKLRSVFWTMSVDACGSPKSRCLVAIYHGT